MRQTSNSTTPKTRGHKKLCVDAEGKTECICGWYEQSGQAFLDAFGTANPDSLRQDRPHADRDNVAVHDAHGRAADIASERFKRKADRIF